MSVICLKINIANLKVMEMIFHVPGSEAYTEHAVNIVKTEFAENFAT